MAELVELILPPLLTNDRNHGKEGGRKQSRNIMGTLDMPDWGVTITKKIIVVVSLYPVCDIYYFALMIDGRYKIYLIP